MPSAAKNRDCAEARRIAKVIGGQFYFPQPKPSYIYIVHYCTLLYNSEIISVLYELYDKPGCYEDPFGSDASEDKTGSLRAPASLHSSSCNSLPESTKPALPDLEIRICHGQLRFVTVTATICHSHHPQEPRSDLKRFEV